MPQYLTPGVYVEEVESAVKPIAGVGTSTAGFIGIVADTVVTTLLPGRTAPATGTPPKADLTPLAAIGAPTLVDGWESFKSSFGDIQDGNFNLASAVYGFFNNGGTLAYVVRIAATAPTVITDALEAFEAIDAIAIVAAPGITDPVVQNALITHCAKPELQDRFAILDGLQVTDISKDAIIPGVNASSYGAVYYPWIDVGEVQDDKPRYVPPSGHVAGVYARVDSERGVFKAPANEVVRGAIGLQYAVSKAEQALLNPSGVNVIRQLSGGVTIWGARTLAAAGDAEWRYISNRRFFSFLRESIDEGTQWAVFEPNSAELWSKIRRNVGAFLSLQWSTGALLGATPAEAFYVRCDATTNPPEVRDAGQLVTEIGVALVRPAEFVIFRLSQWAGPGQ